MPAKATVKMSVHRNRGLATLSEGKDIIWKCMHTGKGHFTSLIKI